MKGWKLASLVLGVVVIFISSYTYLFTNPVLRLLSYQGPYLGGALVSWAMGQEVTFTTKKALIPVLLSPLTVIPWIIPQVFRAVTGETAVVAYVVMLFGGLVAGTSVRFLEFWEKAVSYILGVVADLSFLGILYVIGGLYGVDLTTLLNYLLLFIYTVKFPTSIAVAVYIMRQLDL